MRLTILLLMCACRPLVEAPEAIDDALISVWRAFDATDAQLEELIEALLELPEIAAVDAVETGEQSRLTPADLAVLDFDRPTPDPALARPMYLLSPLRCAPARIEDIWSWPDQNELYGEYDDYDRRFHAPREDWLDGRTDTLSWDGTIVATIPIIANGTYTYAFTTVMRRVRLSGDRSAWLARTHMPGVADWGRGQHEMSQDYQLEALFPNAEGELIHLYGAWRRMVVHNIGDTEGDAIPRITLNQMEKWGRRTQVLCDADALPPG